MESTKSKAENLMGVNTFLALWIGSYVLVYLLMYTADNVYWSIITRASEDVYFRMIGLQESWTLVGFLLMALIFGLVLSLLQPFLIRRHLGITVPRWFLMSMAGWLVGGVFAYYAETMRYPAHSFDGFILSFVAFWMPTAMIQMTLLRRVTKLAWLWTALNLVALLLFTVTYWMINGLVVLVLLQPIGFVPAAVIQGAITAGALFQMFPQSSK